LKKERHLYTSVVAEAAAVEAAVMKAAVEAAVHGRAEHDTTHDSRAHAQRDVATVAVARPIKAAAIYGTGAASDDDHLGLLRRLHHHGLWLLRLLRRVLYLWRVLLLLLRCILLLLLRCILLLLLRCVLRLRDHGLRLRDHGLRLCDRGLGLHRLSVYGLLWR